jgi:hypothetical protein
MKSTIYTALLVGLLPVCALSQTKVTKTYPVQKNQQIELKFDYPKIVHVSTWDKNEIEITASVNINDGANNDAFTLVQNTSGGKVSISNKINMDQIPETFYIMEKGVKTKFNSKKDMDAYKVQNKDTRSTISYYSQKGIEVTLDIKVPADMLTTVKSVYGMIELADFNGPVIAEATYGGIDASLNQNKIGQIKLTNRFGKIFSDLALKPTAQKEENFYTSITASPGKGPSYDISASYGNIYVRNTAK